MPASLSFNILINFILKSVFSGYLLSNIMICSRFSRSDPDLIVENGLLTFDAEGNDNPRSRYFSRRLHVPSEWSGITVGRGYDIKYKKKYAVFRDLTRVGIASWAADKISGGVGKSGSSARKYIRVRANYLFQHQIGNPIIYRERKKNLKRKGNIVEIIALVQTNPVSPQIKANPD